MSGYTVTITPSSTGSDRKSGPKTTIQVDTTSGTARVTELTVHADGSGLTPEDLPTVDFAALVTALTPPTAGGTTTPARGLAQPRRGRPTRPDPTATPKNVTKRRRRTTTADETPESARSSGRTSRAYRRMPDQDEVIAVWNDTLSTVQVAAHFDVPRHTATHWLRRLRQSGAIN